MLLPIEHNESSRFAVSACACVRAFARCGASKFRESRKVPFSECFRPSLDCARCSRNRVARRKAGGSTSWFFLAFALKLIRSVRSPLRRAPLLAAPIATPLQCGRPKRPSGLLVSLTTAGLDLISEFSVTCSAKPPGEVRTRQLPNRPA